MVCLDVLRAARREPETVEALFAEFGEAAGADPRLDAAIGELERELAAPEELESRARLVVERLALALQASLLVRHSPPEIADAFCASRLGGPAGLVYGTLPRSVEARLIIDRNRPITVAG